MGHFASSLKRRLRSTADRAARASGILARAERNAARGLTVLTYHRVLPESRCATYPFPGLAMPLGAFREQVRWLASHGDVLPLGKALERSDGRVPGRTFALTFDDGYHDSADTIAGVLEDAGVRGTFFVTTGFVGTEDLLWFDRAALLFAAAGGGRADGATWARHLKRCRPGERAWMLDELERAAGGRPATDGFRSMSVEDLVGLHRRGHEIGSHTVSHAMLPHLDDAALRDEIERSREAIAAWTGSEVAGFCYPDGAHDERTVAAVERAGHAYACTTRDGVHLPQADRFRVRRVDVAPQRVVDRSLRLDVTAFRRELCGLYRRRGGSRHDEDVP